MLRRSGFLDPEDQENKEFVRAIEDAATYPAAQHTCPTLCGPLPFGISSDIGSRARSRIPGEDDLELGATLERIGPGTASIVQTVFDLSDR